MRLHRLHRANALCIPGHPPRKKAPPPDTPAVVAIFDQIRAVLDDSDNVTNWIAAFTNQQGLFHDRQTAKQAAYDFGKVPRVAASQARHLMQAWLHTDDTALLLHAAYPYQAELALLQEKVPEVARQSTGAIDLPAVLCDLRADMICIAQALRDPALNQHYQTQFFPRHKLYDASLWHQLAHSNYRKRYQERLPDTMRPLIVSALAPPSCLRCRYSSAPPQHLPPSSAV